MWIYLVIAPLIDNKVIKVHSYSKYNLSNTTNTIIMNMLAKKEEKGFKSIVYR